ncbi:MAG: hypothetical protein ACLQQ4_03020 [Bacteroidia bacterium]
MVKSDMHQFHIPVMGLGYTVDAPLKVARFGISSVVSIIEDGLLELMRKFHAGQSGEEYVAIEESDIDHRAKRVTAYLNLLNKIVNRQFEKLVTLPFTPGSEIVKYCELLPDDSPLKKIYEKMLLAIDDADRHKLQEQIRASLKVGKIDVNIMSKIDRVNYTREGEPLPPEYSDALAAFRGFAKSDLDSSIVFSAGYNPRLYSYVESFEDFYPDESGKIKKKIIIKVSDYRSALIQGKIFAKKGIMVSEFRIESGLNCGGHAFATDGLLMGPILEEFKINRKALEEELYTMCSQALEQKGKNKLSPVQKLKITAQGGIGTANEHKFLLEHYNLDGTGWGSPFLLVPEVTNVDEKTLHALATAKKEDYFLSGASPLGIPFNNFRKSSSEIQREKRIQKGRPGSPCYKKFLSSNTEFSKMPICTASREYEEMKIKQLKSLHLQSAIYDYELRKIIEKDCLCEGLSAAPLLKNHIPVPHNLAAVAICPGPNLAYFSGIFSLKQMVDHIYGRINILNSLKRPNIFVNEIVIYVNYLKNKIAENAESMVAAQEKNLLVFRDNLLKGINYYKDLVSHFKNEPAGYIEEMRRELSEIEENLMSLLTGDNMPSIAVHS